MTMLKLFAVICVSIVLIIKTVYSAVAIQPFVCPPPKYEGQPGCYNPDLDIMLPTNEPYAPLDGNCLQYTCQDNGQTQIFSCGAVSAEGCILDRNFSKPYPGCCPEIKSCPPNAVISGTL